MHNKIQQLRQIANDETLTSELRDAAQKQIDELEPQPLQQAQQPDTTKPPTKDFIEYKLHRAWQKLAEPKPRFERWINTEQARELTRKHDAAVEPLVAARQFEPTGNELEDLIPNLLLRMAEREFSWEWEHSRMSDGKSLCYMNPSQYELRGQ